jgi:hypothetical protein
LIPFFDFLSFCGLPGWSILFLFGKALHGKHGPVRHCGIVWRLYGVWVLGADRGKEWFGVGEHCLDHLVVGERE